MTRVLASVLALALAAPAWGEGAHPADAPLATVGRSIEVDEGVAAPFKGNLCDRECAADVLSKRRAADALAALERLRADTAEAERARAERERDEARASTAGWGVVLGVGGGALAAGLIAGLILGLSSR